MENLNKLMELYGDVMHNDDVTAICRWMLHKKPGISTMQQRQQKTTTTSSSSPAEIKLPSVVEDWIARVNDRHLDFWTRDRYREKLRAITDTIERSVKGFDRNWQRLCDRASSSSSSRQKERKGK